MKALILVDIQNDFTPADEGKAEGALAVPEGNAVIMVANELMPQYDLVVASLDWHPVDHVSFAENHHAHQVGDLVQVEGLEQLLWPVHCVQESKGAQLCAGLDQQGIHERVYKGTHAKIDSYSAFYDNDHRQATAMHALLQKKGIDEVHVMGLALDYCVKWTALDAVALGYRTVLLVEGCRGVDVNEGDCVQAVQAMREAGVEIQEVMGPSVKVA